MSTTSERLSAVLKRKRDEDAALQSCKCGLAALLQQKDKEIDRLRRLLNEKEEELVIAVTMIEEYQNERAAPAATDPLDASTLGETFYPYNYTSDIM
ncbi:hypothetical protein HDU88_005128 [Geranomyces variabilis]|nr:hypothetical protein HDU88_005128 [Geranomyces variabilis]